MNAFEASALIDQLRRYPNDVLPVGTLRAIADGGHEVELELLRRLTKAIEGPFEGIGSDVPEAFFCYASLIHYPSTDVMPLIVALTSKNENDAENLVGELLTEFTPHLLRRLADNGHAEAVVRWVDRSLSQPLGDSSARKVAARSVWPLVVGDHLARDRAIERLVNAVEVTQADPDEMDDIYVVEQLEFLRAVEAMDVVRKMFDDERVTADFMDFADFEESIKRPPKEPDLAVTDAVEFLSTWDYPRIAEQDDANVVDWPLNGHASGAFHKLNRSKSELDGHLQDIRAAKETYFPRVAFTELQYRVNEIQDELLQEVKLGLGRLGTDGARVSNSPFLSLILLLASKSTVDLETLLKVFDLDDDSKLDLIGDSLGPLLVFGLTHSLRGNVDPVVQRMSDPNCDNLDAAELMFFFVDSAYFGYLPRHQAIECLWQSYQMVDDREYGVEAAIESLCLLSPVEDHQRLLRLVNEEYSGYMLDAAQCRRFITSPEDGLDFQRKRVSQIQDRMSHVTASVMFDSNAINPPKKQPALQQGSTFSHTSMLKSPNAQRFEKVAKVGRNDLCPCGSGKKYKKCCMRS